MNSLFFTTSIPNLRKILRSRELWAPSVDSFIIVSESPVFAGVAGNEATVEFDMSISGNFDKVQYTEAWFDAHREQASFVASDWKSTFRLPDFLAIPPDYLSDEDAKAWAPDPSMVDRVERAAQLAAFLNGSGSGDWISKERGILVEIPESSIQSIHFRSAAPVGEFSIEYPQYSYDLVP